MSEYAIEVKKLRKEYAIFKREPGFWNVLTSLFVRKYTQKLAVKDVSFVVKEGEFVGFLGPNGAGKTTALKMLSGILYPSKGEAKVLGYVPWQREAGFQKQMAIVMGQKAQLWFDLPAQDSFDLLTDIYDLDLESTRKWVKYLAELLGVTEFLTVQVRRLSLGERMKMELIAALIHKPKVIFLDEPTIGLDVISQKSIREFLKKYNKEEKVTILLTSHYMEDIAELCERVIIINKGEVMYDNSLESLMQRYQTERTIHVSFEKSVEEADLAKLGTVREFKKTDKLIARAKDDVKNVVKKLLDDFPVRDFSFQEVEADEVIRKVFTEGLKK